jgi:membrane-associated protein
VDLFQWLIDVIRDPGELIRWGGYPGLSLIIFVETGALIFFLPGDSLLVMAGVYAAKGDLSMWLLNLLLVPAAVLGNMSSYFIANRLGPRLFTSHSRLLRPEHLEKAHAFYEKHGGKAIVLARFLPIVRTFVPIVAGAARMDYRRYLFFSTLGGLAWVLSMTLIGFGLGNTIPHLERHIEKVAVIVIVVSLLPGAFEWWRHRRRVRAAASAAQAAVPTVSADLD